MATERTYSDAEVALILRRAMVMQPDAVGRSEGGLTLAELRDIAREVGVDPELVTQAASQLPLAGQGVFGRLFGGSVRQETRLVHPAALSRAQLQELVMTIRTVMQHQGRTREVLGAMEWTTVGEVSQVAVTVRTDGGQTVVHVMADRSGAAFVTPLVSIALGAFMAAITGSIIEPGVAGGVAIMGTGLAGGVAMALALWRRSTREFQRKLARLTETIRQTFSA